VNDRKHLSGRQFERLLEAVKGSRNETSFPSEAPIREVTPTAETVPAGVAQIGAPTAWDASRGKGIKVAIIDTGIDAQHPDLAPNVKGMVSFVPGEFPRDDHGSGTHLAGIIGAAENGVGIVGVAPAASLFGVKVLGGPYGSGQISWILQGINWCIQNKMHIVCMSFGSVTSSGAMEAICNAAYDSGLLLFATAGVNSQSVPAPARFRKVIAVSSVDAMDVITPFSGRGPEVEICGPGIDVLSTVPGGGYRAWSGTAAAVAHVAGAAALTWGSHRFATHQQIWNVLAGTARPLGPAGWDPSYDYGRVQADVAALCSTPMASRPLRP
jgi:subtilisin